MLKALIFNLFICDTMVDMTCIYALTMDFATEELNEQALNHHYK